MIKKHTLSSVLKNKSFDPNDPLLIDEIDNNTIQSDNFIIISGPILEGSLNEVIYNLVKKEYDLSYEEDIYIFINSPGGSLKDAYALIDIMESSRLKITTIGLGEVASAATMIVAAGDNGCRFVTKNTSIMTHSLSSGIVGTFNEISTVMKSINVQHNNIIDFWMNHSYYNTKQEIEDNIIAKFDIFMSPSDALKHGIIDGIISDKKINSLKVQNSRSNAKKPSKTTRKKGREV